MNGLPQNVDLGFLQGLTVLQIAVGEFQTQIRLESAVTISVEGEVTVDGWRLSGMDAGKSLIGLVGKGVRHASALDRKDLVLDFSEGPQVIIHDSNDAFESYTIDAPGRLIVV